jgi:hypothetical protein
MDPVREHPSRVEHDSWLAEVDRRSELFHGLSEENLARIAASWVRTGATPDAVSGILAESRRLWVGGAVVYDNFAAASLKALQACERALRLRLALPDAKVTFGRLVHRSAVPHILDYDLFRLGWFRQFAVRFRNELSHPRGMMAFTPGMAEGFLASAHERIAELYPGSAFMLIREPSQMSWSTGV